jgi:3-keto-disaccharide hydrolase
MKFLAPALFFGALTVSVLSGAEEKNHHFYPAVPDPLRGDWQGEGGYVAQVIRASDRELTVNDLPPQPEDGRYEAHIFRQFDQPHDPPVAILAGVTDGDTVNFTGGGWTGAIQGGHFKAANGAENFDLVHVTRTPPTLGAPPPAGAVVLFDGTSMDAWAKKQGKDWLKEDGPSRWKLVEGGAMEVVPGSDCIITHQRFGAYKLHVEFRNLGGPTNSGVYNEDRYEANINEMYGSLTGNACTQFDNCTPKSAIPGIRCSRPPLEWQTMDIEFHPPRFDAQGMKIAKARATVWFNGTLYYHDQPLDRPGLSAARLGEAPTGPLMLQEHGMPCQFRNIWLVELKS